MAFRLSALTSLAGSVLLHAALVFVIAGSARGAENSSQPSPTVFVGSTFEIEELLPEASSPQADTAPAREGVALERSPAPRLDEHTEAPASEELNAAEPEPEREPVPVGFAPAQREPTETEPKPVVSSTPPTGARRAAPPRPAPAPSSPSQASLEPADSSRPTAAADGSPVVSSPSAAPAASGAIWGQAALPPGVASLAKGFTRAAPRAAFRDPVWHRLPLGAAGMVTFSVEVDDSGKVLGDGSEVDDEPAPSYLKGLVRRTLLMLKAGRFALDGRGLRAGRQRFELSARIVQGEPLDDILSEPRDLRQIGRQVEPTRSRPGRANFTYNSGREVQLSIRILDN